MSRAAQAQADRHAFGRRVRGLRQGADKTLHDLAERLGVSVVYVSDVERGRRPPMRLELIDQVAELLDADAAELHQLAAEARGAFSIPTDHLPTPARAFLARLARGDQYPPAFWAQLMWMAGKRR